MRYRSLTTIKQSSSDLKIKDVKQVPLICREREGLISCAEVTGSGANDGDGQVEAGVTWGISKQHRKLQSESPEV